MSQTQRYSLIPRHIQAHKYTQTQTQTRTAFLPTLPHACAWCLVSLLLCVCVCMFMFLSSSIRQAHFLRVITNKQTHKNTHKHAQTLTRTHTNTCTHAYTHLHLHTYTHTLTNAHMHTHTNTHSHTCIHAHTHTHTGGDFPTRKGFLDALLSGCIPVTFQLLAAQDQWLWHWGTKEMAINCSFYLPR